MSAGLFLARAYEFINHESAHELVGAHNTGANRSAYRHHQRCDQADGKQDADADAQRTARVTAQAQRATNVHSSFAAVRLKPQHITSHHITSHHIMN
jgi:hypothetical protein